MISSKKKKVPSIMAVFTFGSNLLSQLGTGEDPAHTSTPIEIPFFAKLKVSKVCCGSLHTLILSKGHLFSFGCNDEYALGRGGDENVPMEVKFSEPVVSIGAGQSSSFCVTKSGKLYGWGLFRDRGGVIGFRAGKNVQKTPFLLHRGPIKTLAVGSNHILYSVKGEVYGLGGNEFGEKGIHRIRRLKKNMQLEQVLVANRRSKFSKCPKIFCGANTSFMVDEKGDAFAFGYNENGQLGLGGNINSSHKRQIPLEAVGSIASGEMHTLIRTKSKKLYAVGNNTFGQLGTKDHISRDELTEIDIAGVKAVKTKGFFSVVQTEKGLYSWGFNSHGECGYDGVESNFPKKMEVNLKNIVSFDVGHDFCVFATKKVKKVK